MPRLKKRKGVFVYKVRKRKPREKKLPDADQNDQVYDSSKHFVDHDHNYCVGMHMDSCNTDVNNDSDQVEESSTSTYMYMFPVPEYENSTEEHINDNMFHASDSGNDLIWNSPAIKTENEYYSYIQSSNVINSTPMLDDCKNDNGVSGKFQELKYSLEHVLSAPYCFHPSCSSEFIEIVEMYPTSDKSSVKLIVIIDQEFCAKIFVHRVQIPCDHDFWTGLPARFDTTSAIQSVLSKLSSYSVCVGNFDEDFHNLVPVGGAVNDSDCSTNTGYREGDFHAKCADTVYNSTIRSTKCQFLVCSLRCGPCSKIRTILRSRRNRLKEKQQKLERGDSPNYLSRNFKHCHMSKEDLIGKINQQRSIISNLEKTVGQLKRRYERDVPCKSVIVDPTQNLEMNEFKEL